MSVAAPIQDSGVFLTAFMPAAKLRPVGCKIFGAGAREIIGRILPGRVGSAISGALNAIRVA